MTSPQKKIVNKIKRLFKEGIPLNILAIREIEPKLLLDVYSVKPFWGWKQALESAGIDYASIKVYRPDHLKCEICGNRYKQFKRHLLKWHGMRPEKYEALYDAPTVPDPSVQAPRQRESKQSLPHWEPHWTAEYVLDRIFELHRKGIPLHANHVKYAEPSTYHWGKRFFKTWSQVLLAAGLEPEQIFKRTLARKWTKRIVISELKHQQSLGREMNLAAMLNREASLADAARRLFKSYDNALKAAGMDPAVIRKAPKSSGKYRTKDQVVDGIIRRKLREEPVNHYAMTHGEHRNLSLWNKGRRLFGSWRAAVEAAEINYDAQIPLRSKYTSPVDVIQAIAKRRQDGLPLTATEVRRGEAKDPNLYTRACRYFENWIAALSAAGVDHKSTRKPRGKYKTKGSILNEIKRRHIEGEPLTFAGIRKSQQRDQGLYAQAISTFGTWSDALKAADIEGVNVQHPKGKYHTKWDVRREIKRRHEAGLPLSSSVIRKEEPKDGPLYTKACKLYGSWPAAITSAGIDYNSVVPQRTRRGRSR